MNKEDLHALTVLGRKFAEYTADNYKKARGRTYICDSEIHYLFDYMHKNEPDYIGITTRFLYDKETKSVIGFQIYELYKTEDFTEDTKELNKNILMEPNHRVAFVRGFRTIKNGNYFDIVYCNNKAKVQTFVDLT